MAIAELFDMDARKSTRRARTATVSPAKSLPPASPIPKAAMSYQSFEVIPSKILLHRLSNNQISLVDLSWSLTPINLISPPFPPSLPIRLLHNGTLYTTSIPLEVLTSTPSDFHSIVLSESFLPTTTTPTDREEYIISSLRSFGLESEPDVKTILEYMHSGRFNSATYNPGGTYDFDRSVSLLGVASRYAMTRIITLVLAEMTREFLQSNETQTQESLSANLDLTALQLDTISRVYDKSVHAWITTYIITVFKTPPGQRIEAKKAVEECIANAPTSAVGGVSEGSMLQRIVAKWFRENKNPSRGKREGELSRLLMMRAKTRRLGSTRRGSSIATNRTGGESVLSTPQGTPVASAVRTMTPTPRRESGRPRNLNGESTTTPSANLAQTTPAEGRPARLRLVVKSQGPQIAGQEKEEQEHTEHKAKGVHGSHGAAPATSSLTAVKPKPKPNNKIATRRTSPLHQQPTYPTESNSGNYEDLNLCFEPDTSTIDNVNPCTPPYARAKPNPTEEDSDSEIDSDLERDLKYDAEYRERIRKAGETHSLLLDHLPL